MPRKKVAHKNSTPNVPSEWRTKARHENHGCQQPPMPSTSSCSAPPPNPYSHKPITMGRRVDFNFFRKVGFSIGGKLKRLSLETLCTLDDPTYPSLISEFYGSLARGSGGFTYRIRGTLITITHILIGRVIQMSTEGITPSIHSDRKCTPKLILGRDEVNPLDVISASQLSVQMGLLHSIISDILYSKIGRFNFLSEWDLIIMHYILEKITLNLPKLDFLHMWGIYQDQCKLTLWHGPYHSI